MRLEQGPKGQSPFPHVLLPASWHSFVRREKPVSQEWGVAGRSLGAEVMCSWQGAPVGSGGRPAGQGVTTQNRCLFRPAQACGPGRQPARA